MEGTTESRGTTTGTSWSSGTSSTTTLSREASAGRSETLRNVYKTLPTQAYTLDELIYLKSVEIANLGVGEAIVKIGARPPDRIRTVRIAEATARLSHIARVIERLALATSYMTPIGDVGPRQLARRQQVLSIVRHFPRPTEIELIIEPPPLKDEGWG